MENKVGIVILNYNGSEYLHITLDSILRAKTEVHHAVGVIDNGSENEDSIQAKKHFDEFQQKSRNRGDFFVSSESNLGFSGGNNHLIKAFLDDPEITHICLLNSDVIVTDYWLDYLLAEGFEMSAPVTNAAGNEQTVAIDYQVSLSTDAFDAVNEYANKRRNSYSNYHTTSDFLVFFCVMISKNIIEDIGLLDEQFFPGSFEDNDYCLRVLQAGYTMHIIRGCFIHHFGSGSFSKLEMPKRLDIANTNRVKFEQKWGVNFQDQTWRLLESCEQDMLYAIKSNDQWQIDNIRQSIVELKDLIKNWAAAISFYQSEQYFSHILAQHENVENERTLPPPMHTSYFLESTSGRDLLKMAWKKLIIKIKRLLGIGKKKEKISPYNNIQNEAISAIDEYINQGKKCVTVFAPMFNESNIRDGYIQRVSAIDNLVLDSFYRIYILDEGVKKNKISIDFIDAQHLQIVFNSHDPEQRDYVFEIVRKTHFIYIHSLLRFMSDVTNVEMYQVFQFDGVIKIWDVHGAVPEEYSLQGSDDGCRIANEVEKYFYQFVDIIVVVSESMKEHLQNKHGKTEAEFIRLPILSNGSLEPKNCGDEKKYYDNELPIIIYSGGVQVWQNVELMQHIIRLTMSQYRYKLLVPEPAELTNWISNEGIINTTVYSVSPDEIGDEYKSGHYGFVLRDDIEVNRVACPTKIIEYLQYGIVPILKAERIGDFVASGMRYVPYENLLDGNMPDEEARLKMVEENYNVLATFKDIFISGKNQLEINVKKGA